MPHESSTARSRRRVLVETGLAFLLAWTAWAVLWVVLSSADWGVSGPDTLWETYRPTLYVVAFGAVVVSAWAVPTLLLGLLLRRGSPVARSVDAAGVALVLCFVAGIGLVASAPEQSGGSSWRLILALTVSSPVVALACYGLAAGATSVGGARSRVP